MRLEIVSVETTGLTAQEADELLALHLHVILDKGGSIIGFTFVPSDSCGSGCYKIAVVFNLEPADIQTVSDSVEAFNFVVGIR